MKVTLKNIGLVESAEINIGGLTVITGHNSVGKSFIGKAIYSVVKAEKENFKYDDDEISAIKRLVGKLLVPLLNKDEIKAIIEEIEKIQPNTPSKSKISTFGHNFLIKSIFKGEYNNISSPNEAAEVSFSINNSCYAEINEIKLERLTL
jgi:energy-coupling factor transporter ATP-binding protein EcfA2